MAQNRYPPYGYKIENGSTVIDNTEAEVIRRIYADYAKGLSYKKIAEQLTASEIRYMPNKSTWNKNMIARILQNDSYLGTEKYPQIVSTALMESAKQMAKPYTHTESNDIKMLKPLLVCGVCGESVRRRLKTNTTERWYCQYNPTHISVAVTDNTLLADIEKLKLHLVQSPQMAVAPKKSSTQTDMEILRLQKEIQLAMSAGKINVVAIQSTIAELATKKYALMGDGQNEEKALAEQIRNLAVHTLDSKGIKAITAGIMVTGITADTLVLNNGQKITIEKSEKGEERHA